MPKTPKSRKRPNFSAASTTPSTTPSTTTRSSRSKYNNERVSIQSPYSSTTPTQIRTQQQQEEEEKEEEQEDAGLLQKIGGVIVPIVTGGLGWVFGLNNNNNNNNNNNSDDDMDNSDNDNDDDYDDDNHNQEDHQGADSSFEMDTPKASVPAIPAIPRASFGGFTAQTNSSTPSTPTPVFAGFNLPTTNTFTSAAAAAAPNNTTPNKRSLTTFSPSTSSASGPRSSKRPRRLGTPYRPLSTSAASLSSSSLTPTYVTRPTHQSPFTPGASSFTQGSEQRYPRSSGKRRVRQSRLLASPRYTPTPLVRAGGNGGGNGGGDRNKLSTDIADVILKTLDSLNREQEEEKGGMVKEVTKKVRRDMREERRI
jgi:hypothetical protein